MKPLNMMPRRQPVPRPSLLQAYGPMPAVDALCEERRQVIVVVARLAWNNPVPWESMDLAFRHVVVRSAVYAVRVTNAQAHLPPTTHAGSNALY